MSKPHRLGPVSSDIRLSVASLSFTYDISLNKKSCVLKYEFVHVLFDSFDIYKENLFNL